MELNPLEKIKDWLTNLPKEILSELISIASHFHLEEKIFKSRGKEQVNLFIEYIDNTSLLKEREIVIRTFLIIKLIDHAVSGRDTENGWTETLDRHISLGVMLNEKGSSTEVVDNFINSFDERKKIWIKIGNDWLRFKENSISDKQIANWYFLRTFEK